MWHNEPVPWSIERDYNGGAVLRSPRTGFCMVMSPSMMYEMTHNEVTRRSLIREFIDREHRYQEGKMQSLSKMMAPMTEEQAKGVMSSPYNKLPPIKDVMSSVKNVILLCDDV